MSSSIHKTAENYYQARVSQYDPDPSKFVINAFIELNGHIAVKVNYPNCINYEGNKILFFKNTTWEQIKNLKELDPHFTDKKTIKPFARFEPTNEGWNAAVHMLNYFEESDLDEEHQRR